MFKKKNKNMAVAQIRPTLYIDHADFETSTIGTEVGGGRQLDGDEAWAGVGLWKKTGYGTNTCTVERTVTDKNKAT